ncbi:hypothetical protein [Burkholderia gladioli]|uniref:hypothetical protein n=1 Tax=Burkholderia gladioli TaxID=28095 RepID=UPI0016419B77|nr:hypothetical protein [Burkholderia gladioli]
MTNEKIPAQGGEMPPVERAAITGSGGIDTVRGAAPAGNAAQDRNTNAADVDRDIAHLIECSESGIARVPRETLVRLRALLTAPRAGLPRHVLASLECTAVWLEKGNDPQDAARELRACLAKIDAAPAAPGADPLRRRVERLLVELHTEGRLSEGQCAKMLDIPRTDWRELAEFLAPDAQAVAADGAPEDEPSEIEQVIACLGDDAAQLRDANPDDKMADNMEAAARLLAERAAFDAWLVDEYPDVAAAMKNEFTNPDVMESIDMARAAWDRASMGAAPADPAVVVSRQLVIDWAVGRWTLEVNGRPLGNVHRRSLDDAWRQFIRHLGADDVSLLGPRHDDLIAARSLSVPLPDSEGGEA